MTPLPPTKRGTRMTTEEKITIIRRFVPANEGVRISDDDLIAYLAFAEAEILSWYYTVTGVPDDAEMPSKFEQIQCMAVVVGLGLLGATGESHHHENGIVRIFSQPDMISYIHYHVCPRARVG